MKNIFNYIRTLLEDQRSRDSLPEHSYLLQDCYVLKDIVKKKCEKLMYGSSI